LNIRITWEDNHIIRYDFPELWSWEDFFKTQSVTQQLIEKESTHPIGVILNIPHNIIIPPQSVANAHQLLQQFHTVVDVIVVAGGNTVVRALVNVINRTYWRDSNRFLHMTDNLEEAREFIAQQHQQNNSSNNDSPKT